MDFGFKTLGPLPGSSRSVCTSLQVQAEGFGGAVVQGYAGGFDHHMRNLLPIANGESVTLV